MSAALWPDAIGRLLRREELPTELVEQVMTAILSGEATDAQIAGFAVALRAKGETPASSPPWFARCCASPSAST